MFDSNVETEGLGRADQAMDAELANNGRSPIGASPDGLGAYLEGDPQQQPYQPPPQQQPFPPQQQPFPPQQQQYQPVPHEQGMSGEIAFLEPPDTSQGAALRSSGFTLLFVALSTGIGYAWKGGQGAVGGLLLSAGAANAYRAQKWFGSEDPSEKHEAMVSSIFAVGEVFSGLYIAYQAAQRDGKSK